MRSRISRARCSDKISTRSSLASRIVTSPAKIAGEVGDALVVFSLRSRDHDLVVVHGVGVGADDVVRCLGLPAQHAGVGCGTFRRDLARADELVAWCGCWI